MRIIWNEQENWFQAEIALTSEHWRDDVDAAKAAHFTTTGPPQWLWHTNKISVLESLRKSQPKSGLTITEQALENYVRLKQQSDLKKNLKKDFEKAKKLAAQDIDSNWKDFIDPDTGIVFKQVSIPETKFVWKYTPPKPPEIYCFMCGDPLYYYEAPDVCLFCEFDK